MVSYSIFLFFLLLIIAGSLFLIVNNDIRSSEISEISLSNPNHDGLTPFKSPASRSLLAPAGKHYTTLEAALDGVIYLKDINSGKVLWSFTSGSPIYSSYQAVPNHENDKENASGLSNNYFFDCHDDDWELYVHRGSSKARLGKTYEEFIRGAPYITENGEVTLGSKKTTVFLIDAKTGKLINTFSDPLSTLSMQRDDEKQSLLKNDIEERVESSTIETEKLEQLLYITRVDYALKSYYSITGKVLWSLNVAEFRASFLCFRNENHIDGPSINLGIELGSENKGDFEMPLPCQTLAFVHRPPRRCYSESISALDGPLKPHRESITLSDHNPPLSPAKGLPVALHESGNILVPIPPPKVQNSVFSGMHDRDRCETNSCISKMDDAGSGDGVSMQDSGKATVLNLLLIGSPRSLLFVSLLVLCIVCFILYRHSQAVKEQGKLKKQVNDLGAQAVVNKRKKARRSANNRNSTNTEKKDKHISSEHVDVEINGSPCVNGRKVGKLLVFNKEIAKGSNGTVVLEGIYDGRPVAVKRLVQSHNDVALKEIQNLIASDRHPNIVRWYGVEYDLDFIYLSLERCTCSLNDLIQIHPNGSLIPTITCNQASSSTIEYNVHLDSVKGMDNKDIELWKANGYPSTHMIKLMRDVVSGLAHLHELGIIHRDLKPQNVLIVKERSLCAKLSDMGISKRLLADMSSFSHHATGPGSSGWQAPEQLLHGRQTRAVDIFSLGCVLFFCITGGGHPFGDRLERDVNIVNNKVDLFAVVNIPEAVDLFTHLLDPNPELRPTAVDVLLHPLFWNSEMRLSFLRDASDRVELEDRENESELLKSLESIAPLALGGKWDEKLESAFINNIGRYRRYKYDSVRDLMRVIRNKWNHYRELPDEIQEILGPVPEGFDTYFASRFPRFLIEVYKVISRFCKDEKCFVKYFKSSLVF